MRAPIDWSGITPRDLHILADLYWQNNMNPEAEKIYQRVLEGKEKAWGPKYTSTLGTVNNLGSLYADQGKIAKAEKMY